MSDDSKVQNGPYPLHIAMKTLFFILAVFGVLGPSFLLVSSPESGWFPVFGGVAMAVLFGWAGRGLAHTEIEGEKLLVRYWLKVWTVPLGEVTVQKSPTPEFPFYKIRGPQGELIRVVRPHAGTNLASTSSYDDRLLSGHARHTE